MRSLYTFKRSNTAVETFAIPADSFEDALQTMQAADESVLQEHLVDLRLFDFQMWCVDNEARS
jgi:hypothetical protein